MTHAFSQEEKKIIFNAVRHWQMTRAPLNGKDYQICEGILTDLFDDVYTQRKEQPT